MKKILIITPGFSKDEQDLSCLPYLQDYILQLCQKIGAENIAVVTTQYPYTKQEYFWNGIHVYPCGGNNKKYFSHYLTLKKAYKKIISLVKSNDYILHAFWMGEAAILAQRVAKKTNAPYMIQLMGQDALSGNRVMRYIDTSRARIIAISENQAEAFFNAHRKKVSAVLPLPVAKIQAEYNNIRDIDLLYTGSMIPVKRPEQFVEVAADLVSSFPYLKAVMIGDGDLMKRIQKKIELLQLKEHITLTGNIPRSEVFNYMQRSKCFVHTSAFEGQCHSFAEALAHGMYVVSNNVGRIENSPKQMVVSSANEMIEQIRLLLSGTMDFTPVTLLYDQDIIASYLELYRSVCNTSE